MQAKDQGEHMLNKPIRDIVYETLKHAIITGEIPAGSRIVETLYANKLHISRTPLREAFRKLELDGLVSCEIRRGVIVRAFTIEDIDEIFSIRNALMLLIAPSIVQSIDEGAFSSLRGILARMDISQREEDAQALAVLNRQFHKTIEHASNKKRILRVIDSQEEYIMRFSTVAIASIVRRSSAHQEHYRMLEHLVARDLPQFERLMQHHLEESKEVCLRAVSPAFPKVD
ncbi:MAG: GntR family transcriptional regulator [Christensenellales bacterium]